MKPVVAVTTWLRRSDTFLGEATELHTLPNFYAAALDRAGATLLLLSHLDPADTTAVLDRVDGLVITGGGDIDPQEYRQDNVHAEQIEPTHDARDLALVRAARDRRMPVLGICRGLQAINVATGGSLIQHALLDGDDHHPALSEDAAERCEFRHIVHFAEDSRMAGIYGSTERKVNSLHHQAVRNLGEGLWAVGTTPDGQIEAVESIDDWPVLAVQWHPEMLEGAVEQALFSAFVADAAAYRDR